MPRTTLTPQLLPTGKTGALTPLNPVWTAADVPNKNQFAYTGKEVIMAKNVGASPHNVTVTSTPDPDTSRTGDMLAAIAAGASVILPDFAPAGWLQSGSLIFLEADHLEIQFAILRKVR